MSIGERIKEIRAGESQSSFGERFGKNRDTIRRYENEANQPDAAFLEALCRHYNVSPVWLLLGEGQRDYPNNTEETGEGNTVRVRFSFEVKSELIMDFSPEKGLLRKQIIDRLDRLFNSPGDIDVVIKDVSF